MNAGRQQLPFRLVTLTEDSDASRLLDERPDDLRLFYTRGVPATFPSQRYRAANGLTVVGNHLVQFGSLVLGGSMCIDPATGSIVELVVG